jgi:hypothetical protein
MFSVGIDVKKTGTELIIKWQFTKVKIPLVEIIEVVEDDSYAGNEAAALRIGPPYGTTDRIFIKAKNQNYILFTTNKNTILNVINS